MEETMKPALLRSCLAVCGLVCMAWSSSAQPPVGALAVDERQGDRYGWAVDYATGSAARSAALGQCGPGCSVVLTFERCAAYAADQDANSTAVGWAESYGSVAEASGAALSACGSRGGSGCIVRVWGCNGPVVEEDLGLDRSARREIQEGLEAQGFDPGGVDGRFGARTREAIGGWQSYRGARATGYLDGASAAALRLSGAAPGTFRERPAGIAVPAVPAGQQLASPGQRAAPAAAPAASAELEGLFWQSMMNSTNPADFEAYLTQFPAGVFRALAQNRLTALRTPGGAGPGGGTGVGGPGSPAAARPSVGASAPVSGLASAGDSPRRPGDVFRDCAACPELVVMADGRLALGRYEVTVGEYRAFASATGVGADDCVTGGSWRDPGFEQADRHPVTCVSWDDAQAYVSWLSRMAGAAYRLPSEAEWARAAAGSQPGCYVERTGNSGTCPVGSYGANGVGLSDMVGNLWEWTQDCWEGDCGRRVLRGGSWFNIGEHLRPGARGWYRAGDRISNNGIRVARTLD